MNDVAVNPQPTAPPSPKRPRLPSQVKQAVLLFTLAGTAMLMLYPRIGESGSQPSFLLLLISGWAVIALLALLFKYLSNLNLGFGKTALTLAFGFNAVIAVTKFTLSPLGLYRANENAEFETYLDPNDSIIIALTSLAILLLYLLALGLIYRTFKRRISKTQVGSNMDVAQPKPGVKKRYKILIIMAIAIGLVIVTGGGILFLLLILLGGSAQYLSYILSYLGLPILLALVAAVVLAIKGFGEVENQIFQTGNTALLASFFWLGVVTIIAFHFMWVVFMITLVSIWPFKTITPK